MVCATTGWLAEDRAHAIWTQFASSGLNANLVQNQDFGKEIVEFRREKNDFWEDFKNLFEQIASREVNTRNDFWIFVRPRVTMIDAESADETYQTTPRVF